MFIRAKVVKGIRYFMVVKGRRDGAAVRQTVIVSLGRDTTIEAALAHEAAKLKRLRRKRSRWPASVPPSMKGFAKMVEAAERAIDRSEARILKLREAQTAMKKAAPSVVPTDKTDNAAKRSANPPAKRADRRRETLNDNGAGRPR